MQFRSLLLLALAAPAAAQCEVAEIQNSNAVIGDSFGTRVDLDGDTAVVSGNTGEVFLFERTPAGWVETQILAGAQGFGASIALDGERLVVGNILDSTLHQYSGAAVTFERQAGVWTQTQVLLPSASSQNLYFGRDVDLEGDRLVVGAPSTQGETATGAVYVFEWDGSAWQEVAVLAPSDVEAEDMFGEDVGISGPFVVGGSRLDKTTAGWISGSATVFEDVAGVWNETRLLSAESDNFDQMGSDVAIDGEWILVGAFHKSIQSAEDGRAYLFRHQGGQWVEHTVLAAPPLNLKKKWFRFGENVALDGQRAVVMNGHFDERVYLYEFDGVEWRWSEHLLTEPGVLGGPGQHPTFSAAISGDHILVGKPGWFGAASSARFFQVTGQRDCFCDAGPYCQDARRGCRNSTSTGAILSGCGSTSVTDDDLRLNVWRSPVGQPGMLLMAAGTNDIKLGDGRMCLGGTLFRFPAGVANTYGHRVLGTGLVAHSQANFPPAGHIQPGNTWRFQYWYRDPVGYVCEGLQTLPSGSNWSNVVAVTFTP
ncbi:MAG: hypothetical protein O2816_12210 [Planctomycetota bacterium]|nr:hypothetical protein [Planctomycetota bacterium]